MRVGRLHSNAIRSANLRETTATLRVKDGHGDGCGPSRSIPRNVASTIGAMRFLAHTDALGDRPVISVDGVCPVGPNFSHWPGHRTPAKLKADTSTGIAFRLLDLDEAERAALLGGLDVVSNNHFDTDGVLSCFAVMQPHVARANRSLFLDAAAAGDFQVFVSREALALDLRVMALAGSAPLPTLQEKYERAFAILPELLADPLAAVGPVREEFDTVLADLERAKTATVRHHAALDLAVIETAAQLDRVAINTRVGTATRVLAICPGYDGSLFRYHDRVESWFDLASRRPPPRKDHAPLAQRLDELAGTTGEERWRAQPIDVPIPEMWFGVEGRGKSFGPTRSGELRKSRLAPAQVERAVVEHFAEGDSRPRG